MFQNRHLLFFVLLSGYVSMTFVPFFLVTDSQMRPHVIENGLFENLTAVAFLMASIILARVYLTDDTGNRIGKFVTRRNIFVLLLAIVFFFGAGEELSWGQHMLGFEPPDFIAEHNRQGELNLHNLGPPKSGLREYLTISKLFSLFWLVYCVCIPLLMRIWTGFRSFIQQINLPIVPLWIGLVFPLNYVLSKIVVPLTGARGHYVVEVKESSFGVLFLVFAFWLYKQSKKNDNHLRNTSDN